MAPLFSSMTISGDPSSHTSPKRRKGLLGRPSFFSRPSATSTVVSTISSHTTLIPLESTTSHSDVAPSLPPKDPLYQHSTSRADKTRSIDITAFLSSRPSQPLGGAPIDSDASEQLQVSLLPSALSNSSLGPSSAPSGPTASNSFGGISASTSRNTVLPASHPILTSSGSTFLPPSLSLGFELQEQAKALPTLASAIKLPSPARPDGAVMAAEKTGAESVITRKPVPDLSAEDRSADIAISRPAVNPIVGVPAPVSALPTSTSISSIFGSNRLRRVTSRSSIQRVPADNAQRQETARNVSASGAGGLSIGSRISRRLSIDHIRPMFNGGSTKRKLSMAAAAAAQQDVGGKMDIQRWAQGAVSGAEAGEAPPILPAAIGSERSDPKAKERLVLPGIRTWRSKFSSSKIPPKPKTNANSGIGGTGSYTESVRSQRLDSWVDVGSVRSNFCGYTGAAQGQQGSMRGLAGALRRMEGADSPAVMSVVEASEPSVTVISEASAPPLSSVAPPTIPAETITNSPLSPSARRSAALLDSLLARPSEEAIAATHALAHAAQTTRTTPGFTTSLSTSSLAPPTNLMSPAADDKSMLEPMRSPLPPMPELPSTIRAEVGTMSEAEEIIRDVRETAAVEQNAIIPDELTSAPLPPSASSTTLPHFESGVSFHTAQSSEEVVETIVGLPRSRSKSVIDISTSASSLIERTEREQGEGWWSAPRAARPESTICGAGSVTRSSFTALPRPISGIEGSPVRPRRSEDRDRRRQSSAPLLADCRRPIVASAVAKLESANAPSNSPRRSILRPAKLQFADADEDDSNVETPTRPTTRRLGKVVDTRGAVVAISPTSTSRHRRDSTTDSFSKLFFGPVVPSPSSSRPTPTSTVMHDELARMRDRHALELDALVSALTAARAENCELRDYASRAITALKEETALRKFTQSKVDMLQDKVELLMSYDDQRNLEFGPELNTLKFAQTGSISRRSSSVLDSSHESSPSARRHRRGFTQSTNASVSADEFGRLDGSPLDTSRR